MIIWRDNNFIGLDNKCIILIIIIAAVWMCCRLDYNNKISIYIIIDGDGDFI